MKDIVAGIDLGTTFSVISYIEPTGLGKPETVKTPEGLHLTPSRVCFANNEIKVGIKNCPGTLAKEFKRKIGNRDYKFHAYGTDYSPIELSSYVLKELKKNAKLEGLNLKEVVITVPAYFDEIRRSATKRAGELAELNVISVINEPTAAALFFLNTDSKIQGNILVYDLGGGTFDTTILRLNGTNIDIITSGGDAFLGGMDFDQLIVELIKEKYIEEKGSGLPYEEDEESDFIFEAEEIKKNLSFDEKITFKARGTNGKAIITITREDFEEKMETYIHRIEMAIESTLESAKFTPSNIDHIIMVGGSTRIPLIRKSVYKLFGKEPITTVDPDESVAKGAAIKAAMLKAEKDTNFFHTGITKMLNDINISEVATVSFGVITYDKDTFEEKNVIIIKKDTKIPCEKHDTFYTLEAGQTLVRFQITTGESTNPSEVTIVDDFVLELPPGRPAEQPIRVTYAYTGDQSLKCIAEDLNSGRKKEYTANNIL